MVRNLFRKAGWLVPLGVLLCGAAMSQAANVTLAWTPTGDPSVVGYRVYQGVASQTYTNMIDVGNATSVTVSNLVGGTTYYFAVTSYTSAGVESPFSGEITYTPGLPLHPQLQISFNASRQAVVSGTGPAGYKYNVLATTDLRTWNALTNITVGSTGLFSATDPSAQAARKFYKLQQTSP